MIPAIPVIIPIIVISPSFPSIPNDISRIPNAGRKLVNGKGNAMQIENARVQTPIALAPIF